MPRESSPAQLLTCIDLSIVSPEMAVADRGQPVPALAPARAYQLAREHRVEYPSHFQPEVMKQHLYIELGVVKNLELLVGR